jgi:hypothetical protein
MTLHKIFYYKKDPGKDIIKTGELFDTGDRYSYQECPVWLHKASRTFVYHSSFEFCLSVNQEDGSMDYSSNLKDSGQYFKIEESLEYDDFYGSNPVIQYSYPEYFFWTESEDIWIEFLDHPLTSFNNNLVTLSGWWNLSNYPRSMSIAFQIVDSQVDVSVQPGDPLYRIKFFSKNFDDVFSIVEKTKIDFDEASRNKLQDDIKSDKILLQDTLFKKSCPFNSEINDNV